VRDTYLRIITAKERNTLHLLVDEDDPESGYRAKIILLKDEGYTVPEIRKITNHHDNNIRKWIHRFNEKGIDGIISKIHKHKSIKFTDVIEKQIVEIATRNPRTYYGLPFSTWSLRVLAGFIMKDMKLVDDDDDDGISHTEIRNILLKHGIKWRRSKTVFDHNQDPEYNIKKSTLNN
jgi:transposase